MDNNTQANALPEKVMRRHLELIKELLPEFESQVLEEGRPADALLNHYLRTHREFGSRDRRFLALALFSYFRWRGWTVDRLGLDHAEACLVGSFLDSTEIHPSFAFMLEQVSLPDGLQPIGDRSLTEKRDILAAWFSEKPNSQPIAFIHLMPEGFESVMDPETIDRSIAEFQQRPPAWIRSRIDATELTSALNERGKSSRIHEVVKEAIAVESGVSLVHELSEHVGQFVVQDIASQCVGLIANPASGEEWWDCCAGAGGKSLHLMDLMNQDGKVLATDIRSEALKELKKRARRHGIRNIRTQPFNAAIDEPFTKTFDGVVVDAPCSGWGTWARNPDARWRTSRKDVLQCANRQQKILNNAKWCVKPGGILIYAVCTPHPSGNRRGGHELPRSAS